MERTMTESAARSPSSSQSKRVSSPNYRNPTVEISLLLTGVLLFCFLYVFDGSLLSSQDTRTALTNRIGASEVVQNLKLSNGVKGRHFLKVKDGSHASRRNLLAAAAKKDPAKYVYVATNISTGMISLQKGAKMDPLYHNSDLFQRDYAEMKKNFKIFVYPEAFEDRGVYKHVFLPHHFPESKNIGNYYSEHKFKITLLKSKFVTNDSAEAHLFYLPFSVNVMRNDFSVRTEPSIIKFVKSYIENVSQEYEYWNRSRGADHFFACCHSVGRDVPTALPDLKHNAIQLVCSSNYYYKNYYPHKDVALPQIWPRKSLKEPLYTPEMRDRLAFYAGRLQNSNIRQLLIKIWGADPDLDFYAGGSNGSYERHFQNTKFCVHVRGYEVNTARISDAIHFGCVPIIISDYYDLPLSDILDWSQFSIIISYTRIPDLKKILQAVTDEQYSVLYNNVLKVRRHFQWNDTPKEYDAFSVSLYQLWLKRFVVREAVS
ncbi:unnamed protein product [Calypogeia fissa]